MASLLLRGLSLGAKFLLLLAMARYLTLVEVGRYGLVVATVNILSRLAGAEFYTVTSRELVTARAGEQWRIINGQALVTAAGLLLVVPFCWLATEIMELGISWPMLAFILMAHQVGMETTRFLIALGQPLRSYLVGALVNGVWPVLLIAVWLVASEPATLSSVWWAWLLGASVGGMIGIYLTARSILAPWNGSVPGRTWTRRGFRTAALFLIAAAALRAIEFADRFIVELFLGTAAVGVYTYYASFAKLAVELPSVLVVSPRFPEIMRAMEPGQGGRARSILQSFTRHCVALAVVSLPLVFGGLWVAAGVLDKPAIRSEPGAYILLLLGTVLLAASQGFHYALYGARRDREIATMTVLAAATNIVVGFALTPAYGMIGAAFGTFVAMGVLLAAKAVAGRRVVAALAPEAGT